MGNRNYAKAVNELLAEKQKYKCYYCGCELYISGENNNCSIDHVKALSKEKDDSLKNLVACCKSCNSSKGSKTLLNFRRGRFLESIGIPNFSPKQRKWLFDNLHIFKNFEELVNNYKFYGEQDG